MKTRSLALIALCLLLGPNLRAQDSNLFNLDNSLRFAQFLNQKGSHEMAILEWERINQMQAGVDSFQFPLIQSYRLSGRIQGGIQRFDLLFPNEKQYSCSEELAREMNRLLFLNKDFSRLSAYIQGHQNLPETYKQSFGISNALRNGQFQEAQQLYSRYAIEDPRLNLLIDQGANLKYKSKALAVAMSTLVPGAGKAYLGNWQDGLLSLAFIAGTAYGSYRGFNQQGINSTYGWLFGTISTGFYLGNLFGTSKAVTKYNQSVWNHYEANVESFLYRRL